MILRRSPGTFIRSGAPSIFLCTGYSAGHHLSSQWQAASAATAPSAVADEITATNNAAGVGKAIRRLMSE